MPASTKSRLVEKSLQALKAASVGASPDIPYEQAFANIAHEFIRSRVPTLMDYEIGFQLIDKSKEGEKALGVFGFQIGDRSLLVPAIYQDGEVKGHEMIYVVDQNLCVPSTEAWVSYLTQKQPDSMGETVSTNRSDLGIKGPALALITRSPLKFASFKKVASRYAEWCHPFLAWFAKLAVSTEAERLQWAPGVGEQLGALPLKVQENYLKLLQDFPAVKAAAEKLNQNLYSELERNIDKSLEQGRLPRTVGSVLGPPKAPVKALRITYYHEVSKSIVPHDLSDADREKLVRDGYLIHDNRKQDQKPTLHVRPTEQESLRAQNPTENNLMDVLVRPGKFERCLVLTDQVGPRGRRSGQSVMVIRKRDRKMIEHDRNDVFVDQDLQDKQETLEFLKALPTAEGSAFRGGGRYVVLQRHGDKLLATCCFDVNRSLGQQGDDSLYDINTCWHVTHEDTSIGVGSGDREAKKYPHRYDEGPSQLRVSKDAETIRFWPGEIVVPQDARVLKVQEPARSSRDDDFQISGMRDLVGVIWKGLSRLEVHRNFSSGREYRLNLNEPVTKSAAVLELVKQYELAPQDAEWLLEKVQKGEKLEVGIKKADNPTPWLIDDGKSEAPDIPQWDTPVGANWMANPNTENDATMNWQLPVDGLMASRSDPANWDPRNEPPTPMQQQSLQQAMQAAQKGQRDLFNTKSILSIVNKDQSGDMGPLIKCMDALGRRYLAFCWQRESMNDQYGSADASDIEDSLIENFEGLGEMVIAMYERDLRNGDHTELLKAKLTIHSEDIGGSE